MTFLRSFSGANVLKFAFVGPAFFLLLVGGLDLLAVSRSQARLQTIANGAAAVGANAPASDMDGAKARAAAFVAAEISRWPNAPLYDANYEIVDRAGRRTVRVVLLGHRTSFLANMLPPGGWKFVGDSSAAAG
ncbi:MAG: hypothetical protein ACOH1E_10540 [Brevundimonas sp.]